VTRAKQLRAEMSFQRSTIVIVLVLSALLIAACSGWPFRLFGPGATPQPVIILGRCDEGQDVLCLVTFGLEPPDQMLIVLLASPGLPPELEAEVTHAGTALPYPCKSTDESPTIIYCTGPQIPLGSSIGIGIYAAAERTLLASGEFVLTAFALPTLPADGVELPTPLLLMTARPTRTPISDLVSPTASALATPRLTQTPIPGTVYPNPNL